MELRHLRYFIAVAEQENISRAALKLHVSQPALSRQVRDLENEIGFQLFERSAKSVRLTGAGRVFLDEARAVLQRADGAVKTVRAVAMGAYGEVHVGYAPSLTARLLPPTLRAFQAATPGLRVKLRDLSTEEMLTGLREGKLQIAFLVRPTPGMLRGLQFEPLMRDPVRLAMTVKHPLARRRTVTLAEATREPFVAYNRNDYPEYHELLAAAFSGVKTKPRIVEEHDGVTSLIAGVEAGNGVALVPESLACLAGSRVKLARLSPAPAPIVVGAAWSRTRITPATEQFLQSAREVVSRKQESVAGRRR